MYRCIYFKNANSLWKISLSARQEIEGRRIHTSVTTEYNYRCCSDGKGSFES